MARVKEIKKRKQKEKILIKKVGKQFYIWTSESIKKEAEPDIILKHGEENKVKIGVDWVNKNIDKYFFISDKALTDNGEVDFEKDCAFFWELDSLKKPSWVKFEIEKHKRLKDFSFVRDFCCGGRCGGSLNQEIGLIKEFRSNLK